jgi:hypothetical protein
MDTYINIALVVLTILPLPYALVFIKVLPLYAECEPIMPKFFRLKPTKVFLCSIFGITELILVLFITFFAFMFFVQIGVIPFNPVESFYEPFIDFFLKNGLIIDWTK